MIASPCRDVVEEEARNIATVDRLDQQADAGLLQSLGGERQVLDEDVLQRGAIHALRRDAGKAIDLAAAERPGIGDRRVDAAAKLVDAVGQDGDAALAARPVAGRQVEQHLRQPVLLEPCRDHLRRMIVGPDIFDALEAGARGGVEAVEELMLAKEHRQIG